MERIKMEEKILKWIKSENENVETSVLGLDGDFGTGKTTYITKVFDWKKVEKETKRKSIYINLLNLDLDDKFINNLIKMFNKSKDFISIAKEKATDTINQLKNTFKEEIWLKMDAFDDIKTIENRMSNYEKSKEKFFNNCVLILDDIERINPENILKTLGLINQLSYKYQKMKILVPYNSKVLNDILNNFFGIQDNENNENYLQKYLGNSINFIVDYVELKEFIEKGFRDRIWPNNNDNPKPSFIQFLKRLNLSWRDIILLGEIIDYKWEFFVEKNQMNLFNKKIFQGNIITYQNEKFLILKNEETFFRNVLKLREDIKLPKNIQSHSEVKDFTLINQEIYNFFEKYHKI